MKNTTYDEIFYMRIQQCYISKSIQDFPWLSIYRLDDYNSVSEPAVFFGCYRHEDYRMIRQHEGRKIVFWTGQDALNFKWDWQMDAIHVTAHPKVHALISKHVKCQLVQPSSFLNEVKIGGSGPKIYAYCPSRMPEYHGIEIIQQLEEKYDIIIGDGSISQEEWRSTQADIFYGQCYIGLCLSTFAGGGTSIIEMGLRGMRVVTNVFNLSNCIKWSNIDDIVNAIERYKGTKPDRRMAQKVFDELDHTFDWLNI